MFYCSAECHGPNVYEVGDSECQWLGTEPPLPSSARKAMENMCWRNQGDLVAIFSAKEQINLYSTFHGHIYTFERMMTTYYI